MCSNESMLLHHFCHIGRLICNSLQCKGGTVTKTDISTLVYCSGQLKRFIANVYFQKKITILRKNFARFNVWVFCDLGKFTKVYLRKLLFPFLGLRTVLYIVPLFGCSNGVVEVLFGKSLPDPNGA